MKRKTAVDSLWKNSDDAIGSMRKLSVIYDNVPLDLDVDVWVDEFHTFECDDKLKEKVLKWLNER